MKGLRQAGNNNPFCHVYVSCNFSNVYCLHVMVDGKIKKLTLLSDFFGSVLCEGYGRTRSQ